MHLLSIARRADERSDHFKEELDRRSIDLNSKTYPVSGGEINLNERDSEIGAFASTWRICGLDRLSFLPPS